MAFPIFDKVGGSEVAIRLIADKLGKYPTKFVQDKWRSKGKLPFKVGMLMMNECQRLGVTWEHPSDFEWEDEATQ